MSSEEKKKVPLSSILKPVLHFTRIKFQLLCYTQLYLNILNNFYQHVLAHAQTSF